MSIKSRHERFYRIKRSDFRHRHPLSDALTALTDEGPEDRRPIPREHRISGARDTSEKNGFEATELNANWIPSACSSTGADRSLGDVQTM